MSTTKQDYDRAIKGSRERILKLEKKLNRVNNPKQKEQLRKDIAGNKDDLNRLVSLRQKAPSKFKDLNTKNADSVGATELVNFIDNSESNQRNIRLAILPNLDKKAESGTYDEIAAQKLWRFEVDRGDKEYAEKELLKGKNPPGFVFDVPTRNLAAKKLATEYTEENRHHIAKGRRNLFGV